MEYIELRLKVNKTDLERAEAVLIENGYVSMLIDDPDDVRDIMEHPDVYRYDYMNSELTEDLDRRPEIVLYFADDEEGRADRDRAMGISREFCDGSDAAEVEAECVNTGDDSEWLYKWQEHFKPTRVGRHIVVKPSWEEYSPKLGDLVIEMDPGMAFGSGLHETTSMCIRALEEIMGGGYLKRPESSEESGADMHAKKAADVRILDVGTGTGILAIAGVLLGAGDALGVDIDMDAVRVAADNIEHNNISDRISVQYGDLTEGVDYEADILVANLMADLVIKLSPAAARHIAAGGWYITSGILDIKEEVVTEAICAAGFSIDEVLHDGEWCAVIAHKVTE